MISEVLTLKRLERMGANEAAALLRVRQDAGGDNHDEVVFDAWLAADPANAEAWTRVCGVWADFDASADDPELQELRDEAREEPAPRRRWGLAIAASAAIVAVAGGSLLLNERGKSGTAGSTLIAGTGSVQTLTTAKGEQKSFALADASTVTLNTNSAVTVFVRRSGERRLELIRGQAFFKVAPDKERPFVVAFDNHTVTALGTAFEVRADGDAMRVVLVEGRVSVSRPGGPPVLMRPGQQLIAGPRSVTLSTADISAINDWQRGVVTFRDTTLGAAATEFNRYADRQLVVADPRVARLKVSGVFRTDDAGRFARTIEVILPVRVAENGDKVEITSASAARVSN